MKRKMHCKIRKNRENRGENGGANGREFEQGESVPSPQSPDHSPSPIHLMPVVREVAEE